MPVDDLAHDLDTLLEQHREMLKINRVFAYTSGVATSARARFEEQKEAFVRKHRKGT